jgi:hypothetical protein
MDDRQLIADLLSALEYHTAQTRPIEFSKVAIQAAREYLQKPAKQEPEWYHFVRYGEDCFVPYSGQAPNNATPLYTAPKPLTEEQREEIAKGLVRVRDWTVGDIIDATEAAHGIKENT